MIELGYFYLGIAALLPVLASILFFFFEKKFNTLIPYALRQVIIGIVFGGIAIIGTEWGIYVDDSVVNCRDAAVLCAGLIFGGPAGIIAGIIGGVERYFAVLWGAGYYTQIGCSISTMLAGFFAYAIRRFQLEGKRPNWAIAFLSGITMESIHMSLVFATHLNDVPNALDIVIVCAPPMMIFCSLSVMLSVVAVNLLDQCVYQKVQESKKSVRELFLSKTLVYFVIVFILFSGIAYSTESIVCMTANEQYLEQNLTNVKELNLSSIVESSQSSADDLSEYRKFGDTGYIVLSEIDNGNIVSAPCSLYGKTMQEVDLGEPGEINPNPSTIGAENCSYMYDAIVDGISCECMDSYLDNYRLTAVYPIEEGNLDRDRAFILILLIQILLFSTIIVIADIIIGKNVVVPIRKVNNSLQQITDGNLDTVIDEKSNLEFIQLSDGINTTVDSLQKYTREAQERMEKELELAHNIQHSAMPTNFDLYTNQDKFDIYACINTAKKVGGDFYDFYFTGKNTLNFLIADVSGKGIPAAMFMMRAKTQIKNLMETGIPLDEVITRTNVLLCEDNQARMFVTLWLGSVNLDTGKLTYVNAGHNSPVIIKNNANADFIHDKHDFVLGVSNMVKYNCQYLQLNKGDALYLYTDGVNEAMTKDKTLFGNDRLIDTLSKVSTSSMKKLCDSVIEDVNHFVKGAPQSDDTTMLAFRYGGENATNSITLPANNDNTRKAKDFILDKLKAYNADKSSLRKVSVVIDELFRNVASYAYPDNDGEVEICGNIAKIDDDENQMVLHLKIVDSGVAFDPLDQTPPNTNASADARVSGGYGIFITRKLTDKIEYKRENDKNILTMEMNFICEEQ